MLCHSSRMGYLLYGDTRYQFEDRLLAHLQAAIVMRLRKQESFLLNWTRSPEEGSGRCSIWLSPSCPVVFGFSDSHTPKLNPTWVTALISISNTTRGMVVCSEEEAEKYARSHPKMF